VIKGLKPVVQLEAVDIGKAIVKDEEVWSKPGDRIECIASVDVMDGFMGCLLVNNLHKEISNFLIIFDYKYQFGGSLSRGFGREYVIKHNLKIPSSLVVSGNSLLAAYNTQVNIRMFHALRR